MTCEISAALNIYFVLFDIQTSNCSMTAGHYFTFSLGRIFRPNSSPYCSSRRSLLLTKVMVITMFKMYLYTAMRWIETFIAAAVIILLQMFASFGSLLVKEYVYSEINLRGLVFCVVLTIAVLFAAYFLMKTKFYVIPLGKVMFCLYAIISIVTFPRIIGSVTMAYSAYEITAGHYITDEIITIVLIIIETLIVPILTAIFAFKAERNYKIKQISSQKE